MDKIIDLSKVQEIFFDEKEEIVALLKLFISTLPKFMETIERCIENNDIPGFKFAIHKFKSSCQFVASSTFVDRLKTLERLEIKDFNEHLVEIEYLKAKTLQLKQEVEDYLEVNEAFKD